MRDLTETELSQVAGAGRCCGCKPDRDEDKGKKGNNGYGNGGDDGVPGRSGKQDYTR